MERERDFTYDSVNFAGFPDYIDELHADGLKVTLMFVRFFNQNFILFTHDLIFSIGPSHCYNRGQRTVSKRFRSRCFYQLDVSWTRTRWPTFQLPRLGRRLRLAWQQDRFSRFYETWNQELVGERNANFSRCKSLYNHFINLSFEIYLLKIGIRFWYYLDRYEWTGEFRYKRRRSFQLSSRASSLESQVSL